MIIANDSMQTVCVDAKEKEVGPMRRVVHLAAVAMVATLILAPAVLAQQTTGGTMKMEQTV